MSGEALIDAAREGMLDVAERLVAGSVNVVAADAEGRTALHHAILTKHETVALFLIEQHPPGTLDVRDNEGRTPLTWAAEQGMPDVVKKLAEVGADMVAADLGGRTALHWAYDEQAMRFLIKQLDRHPPGTIDVRNSEGDTPLMLIAEGKGTLGTMKALVEAGADMLAADARGRTALHNAIIEGNTSVVRFLIDQHPPGTLNVRDNEGATPLMWAASKDISPLEPADEQGRVVLDMVEALVAAGADMEAADEEGCRALHYAILVKHEAVALFLIQRGCDVHGQGHNRSPFMLAVDRGLVDVGEMLLSKGAVNLGQVHDFDVDDYHVTLEFLRPIMDRSIALRRLYMAVMIGDAPQAMRRAREEAARQGLSPREQEEKALAAATFLRGRVEGNQELPSVGVSSADDSMRTLVAKHLAEVGLIEVLVGELMYMLVPVSDSARRGEPLGHMIEQWEAFQDGP